MNRRGLVGRFMKNKNPEKGKMIEVFVDPRGKEWEVDPETGEMSRRGNMKKLPTRSEKYVGIDTKEIKDCYTEDHLLETISLLDGYVKDRVKINDTFLAENVIAGLLSPAQLLLLRCVAQRVCAWNIYIGSRKELVEMGADPKSLRRTLNDLNAFLRIDSEDKPDKGCLKIYINPLIAWKGDNEWRTHARETWYGIRTDIS